MDNRNVKGQGSFKTNPDGTVTYRKGVGVKEDGKRKTLTVTASNKAMCVRIMREKESEWKKQKEGLSGYRLESVEELCNRHLFFQMKSGELKPKSVDRREITIKNQIGKYPIGHRQIREVTSADIEEHINSLIRKELSVSSIIKALDVISAAYDWGMMRGELDHNPTTAIRKGIKRRLKKLEVKNAADADVIVLSEEEEQRFTEACIKQYPNGRYVFAGGLFGRLLIHTGMRVGEMISLRWSDYDKEGALLTINKNTSMIRNRDKKPGENNYIPSVGTTKNQKARVIQLSDEAQKDLELIYMIKPGSGNDFICRSKKDTPYTASMLEHCMATIYRSLGFDDCVSGLHVLRRTFATRMYDYGAGVKEIAAYIGDLESTTMQYYIAARKKIRIGTATTQYVPMPRKSTKKHDYDR